MMEPQSPIRIVIADDHPLVRDGLRRLFELQPGFAVIGEAGDGLEAIQQAERLRPDVLLLDLAMPRMNGLEVLKMLAASARDTRIVLLTAAIEREETVQALRLGARGVVLKESATEMLYKCIHAVMKGEYWFGHDQMPALVDALRHMSAPPATPAETLTAREVEIIGAIADGATNRDVARQLGVTEQTVKNHLSHIYDKLGVSNRLELALFAIHHKLPDRRGLDG